MAKRKDKFYQFRPLSGYSFKDRMLIKLLGWLAYVFINAIGKTIRFEVDDRDYQDSSDKSFEIPILCTWHDRIFSGAYYLRNRGLVVMSSISFDAEYTARCIQRFGFGVIKGSSTRGGARALVEMVRAMKQGIPMLFTIDGPRGPRYKVKAGPTLLAKLTGYPMLPGIIELKSYWKIKSWDRSQLPIPFTRAKVFYGEPIFVSPDADDNELEQKREELQHALDDLVKKGQEWACES